MPVSSSRNPKQPLVEESVSLHIIILPSRGIGMFVWGLLSIGQMVFLPGYLVLRTFGGARRGMASTWICVFNLSLLLNFFMVLLLTVGGFYTPIATLN